MNIRLLPIRELLWCCVVAIVVSHPCGVAADPPADVTGGWRGGMLQPDGSIRDADVRCISTRPDGSLALSLIYEVGPRSRVWKYDTDVTFAEGEISWIAHTGRFSADGDTMYVAKEWKGEKSEWRLHRDRRADDLLTSLAAWESPTWAYRAPETSGDGWNCATLQDAGIDAAPVLELMRAVATGDHGDVHSILVARDGRLVLEEYFALGGSMHGELITETFRDKPHHLASTTKAVTSALVGIAIDDGLIESVDAPLFSLLPDYAHLRTDDKMGITVEHLLAMTAGLQWQQARFPFSDSRNDAGKMYRCGDVIEFVLAKPVVAAPGEKFRYSNGISTVAGAVIEGVSGMNLVDFARAKLFEPLGIVDWLWTSYPDGTIESDGGLALRSRDLARFGQLFLDSGRWRDQQLVSENWVNESTAARVDLRGRRAFGYYWNEMKLVVGGVESAAWFAPGDGGQFLAVIPDLQLVFVATAGNYGKDPTSTWWKVLDGVILPACESPDGG